LAAQVEAGAAAPPPFHSWGGGPPPRGLQATRPPPTPPPLPRGGPARVARHTRSILEGVASLGVPRIHFGTGTAGLLELIAATGPDIVSLDWRVNLDEGWKQVGLEGGVER